MNKMKSCVFLMLVSIMFTVQAGKNRHPNVLKCADRKEFEEYDAKPKTRKKIREEMQTQGSLYADAKASVYQNKR